MKNIEIKFSLKGMRVGLILTVIFLLVIAYEVYVAYNGLYNKLSTEPEMVEEDSIVRVDLQAYQDTIQLLNELENFEPPSLILNHFNPFQ